MAQLQTWDEIVASTLSSDQSIREELQDAIYNVSPYDTPLLSRLQQVSIGNKFVQWQTASFRAAADNSVAEGIAFTAISCTQPSRASNISQLFYEGLEVSDTDRQVNHAGMSDPFAYQEAKKLVELKKDIELALVKGSAITGTTSSNCKLGGFMNVLSTNKTSLSGITFTESTFTNLLQLAWGNSEVMPTEVFVGPNLKRTISNYSTRVTPFIDAESKKQIVTVSNYESDFGSLKIFLHRNLTSAGSSVNELLIIDPAWFATGWLQPLKREVLPRTGIRSQAMITCDATLLYKNEASAIAADKVQHYIP